MINENFNPVYNDVEQVKRCATFMLNEEVVEAKIALVIGHNGRSFVSSTDWRLTTASGAHRIMPFAMRPQYPNFLECVAGVSYENKRGQLYVTPDGEANKLNAVVELLGKKYRFFAGEALKIYADRDTQFIATDCVVEYEERPNERIFRVIPDDHTIFGLFDSNGRVSRI